MSNKPSLSGVIKTFGFNQARRLIGLHPQAGHTFTDWLKLSAQEWLLRLVGLHHEDALPGGFPKVIWETINGVLMARGGLSNKEFEAPNFWLSKSKCTVFPHMLEVQVDYAPSADGGKVYAMEEMIEDALARAGHELNIRVVPRPLRIQIDRPNPETQALINYWPHISNPALVPINQFFVVPAVCWENGKTRLLVLNLAEPGGYSSGDFAQSGGGKTQLALDKLLSAAMLNSPEVLSILILDPKAIDFGPMNTLTHLAAPVITDVDDCIDALAACVAEMDRRTQAAKVGDRSFADKRILIFVDEVADLLVTGGTKVERMLQRLTQKGRGLGFSIILCSQRAVKGMPANVLNNLGTRFVGRMGNASESTFATGVDGSTCHRLPGKGAFEVYSAEYPRGFRVQAFYVGDSKSKDYDRQIGRFIHDIRGRWGNVGPHWRPGVAGPLPTDGEPADEAAPAAPPSSEPASDIDSALLSELTEEYLQDPEAFCVRTVRRVHSLVYQKEARHEKAKRIYDLFIANYVTNLARN